MISILRLGHRRTRDQRVTTHVALVSRAFGADEIVVAGDRDESLERSVRAVVKNWGGKFSMRHENSWKQWLVQKKAAGWRVVHLTMYGAAVQDEIAKVKKHGDVVVVVGSQKMPPEIYQLADYNISVTGQPHSEIAALAIFLDRYVDGKELSVCGGGEMRNAPRKFCK